MDRQAFIAWLKQQKYAGKIQAGTPEALARLDACLDRLEAHLSTHWGGVELVEMPLAALQRFPFDLVANDDGNLGSLFSYLGRADVQAYLERTGERSNAIIDYAWFIQQASDLEDQIIF